MTLSPERTGRITASAVGAILGLSPYQSADAAMRRMVRDYHGAEPEFVGNVATRYGQEHEPIAIIHYVEESSNLVEPSDFVVHPHHGWLGATPDGVVGSDGLVEIKCPFGLRNDPDPQFKSLDAQPHYAAQVQVQLACTGRDWCDFVQWTPVAINIERVYRDEDWFEAAMPALVAFHERYLAERNNPDHLRPLRVDVQSRDAQAMASEYFRLRAKAAEAEAEAKTILAALVRLTGGADTTIGEHKLTLVCRDGAVAYAKAVRDHLPDLDLESYRAAPSEYWTLK